MGLTYYFRLSAPASTPTEMLELFLRNLEPKAQSLGFGPTVVLNVEFNTPERRDFSRRVGGAFYVQDERLKGISLPISSQAHRHDPFVGICAVYPERGVLLVLTDEQGRETCFGFLKFPKQILDIHGKIVAEPDFAREWNFQESLKTQDQRIRQIVHSFRVAGYVAEEKDEFLPEDSATL